MNSHWLTGKSVVIAGGSGFLGTSLASYLSDAGAKVTVLSRSVPRSADSSSVSTSNGNTWEHECWDAVTQGDWTHCLDGADALVNLTGRTVDCIKTPNHQDEILRSRVESTRVLGKAMRSLSKPPSVWVQMSTAHIYGDPPSVVCNEDSAEGIGFAPTIGRAWESAFADSKLAEQRGVVLRTSFVVGRDRGAGGGAMAKLGLLTRLGLGGRVGAGTQGMSWIHELDLNRLFARAITDQTFSGMYIASSPNPVSQVEFMRTLRGAIGMPIGLPAFEWMVRVGAPLLLRTDAELALYGRYVVSKRLEECGFEWDFPTLNEALLDLYS
jgi:uncharacterized protein (TIGR01777 family)